MSYTIIIEFRYEKRYIVGCLQVKQGFREGIDNAMNHYDTDDDMNEAIDNIQNKVRVHRSRLEASRKRIIELVL